MTEKIRPISDSGSPEPAPEVKTIDSFDWLETSLTIDGYAVGGRIIYNPVTSPTYAIVRFTDVRNKDEHLE